MSQPSFCRIATVYVTRSRIKIGIIVLIIAIGAALQWLANSPSLHRLLIFARFMIGFGLKITLFTTPEVCVKLFPDDFGFMVGVHALIFNTTIFLAFILLRLVADSAGTSLALLVPVLLCAVSTAASVIAAVSMRREDYLRNKEETESDQTRITNTFASLATVMTPHEPRGWQTWKLPASFCLTILGNKAIGCFFDTLSIFSVDFCSSNHAGVSLDQAALATGLSGLVAGFLSPVIGGMMDKYGIRSRMLAIGSGVGLLGFVALFIGDGGSSVWIATATFAVMNGLADMGLVMIPLVVGASRAGVGSGIYGLLGNIVDAVISFVGGHLLGSGKDDFFLFFSASVMTAGIFSWTGACLLERSSSFIESPMSKIIETIAADLHSASLAEIILPASIERPSAKIIEATMADLDSTSLAEIVLPSKKE